MEITLLIKSILGLVVLLAILLILFIYVPKTKTKKTKSVKKAVRTKEKKIDLESLRRIIKDKQSSSVDLKNALDLILKDYGNIHKKLGLRPHPDFNIYMDILIKICKHANTSKDIILGFDKELIRLNPEYKKEINDAITKGLNSRGV